jgi:hypothetical protein
MAENQYGSLEAKKYKQKYDVATDNQFRSYFKKYARKQGIDTVKADFPTYWRLFEQASYNFQKDQDNEYGAVDYNPWDNDESDNLLRASYVKKNKKAPTPEEFTAHKTRAQYEKEYDKTIQEDIDAYEKGEKPFKYQTSEKIQNEAKALFAAAQKGNLLQGNYAQIAPTLLKLHQSTVEAEQKRLKKAADADEEPEADYSDIYGKKVEKSKLDLDTLKQIGYDEKTGFQALLDQLVKNAPQTQVEGMERQNMARQQYAPTMGVVSTQPRQMPAPVMQTKRPGSGEIAGSIPGRVVADEQAQQGMRANLLAKNMNLNLADPYDADFINRTIEYEDRLKSGKMALKAGIGQGRETKPVYVPKEMRGTWLENAAQGDLASTGMRLANLPQEAYLKSAGYVSNAAAGKPILQNTTGIQSFRDWSAFNAQQTGSPDVVKAIDTVPVLGAIANFSFELLTDPTNWIAGGVIFDALKAKGLADPKSLEYAQAFVKQQLPQQADMAKEIPGDIGLPPNSQIISPSDVPRGNVKINRVMPEVQAAKAAPVVKPIGRNAVNVDPDTLSDVQLGLVEDIAGESPNNIKLTQKYYGEYLDETEAKIQAATDEVAKQIKAYQKKGINLIPNDKGGFYKQSNNDLWYRDFWAKTKRIEGKGRAPKVNEIPALAREIIENPKYAGLSYPAELADEIAQYKSAKGFYDKLFKKDIQDVSKIPGDGYEVKYDKSMKGNPLAPRDLAADLKQPRTTPRAAQAPVAAQTPAIGMNTGKAPQAIADAAKQPRTGYSALAAKTPAPKTLTGKLEKPKPIGQPGQSRFDLQQPLPEGVKERGVSENIRTDANSPVALREDFANKPLDYKELGNAETLGKAVKEYDAAAGDMEKAINRLDELSSTMKPESAPLAKLIARNLTESGNVARARQVIASIAVKATEAGQFGQAFRILRDADPETLMLTLERQLKKLNADGQRIYGGKWKDFDLTPGELDKIGKMPQGDEGAFREMMEEIRLRIADEMPSGAIEKLTAWRHMAMLLNPKTHIRNVVGNTIQLGLNKAANKISAGLQKFLPKDVRTQAFVVKKETADLAKKYYADNAKDLLAGGNKYDEGIGMAFQDKRVFKAKPLEAARKFNYAALQAEDAFFFKRAYTDRLASMMQARGIKSLDDLTPDMLKYVKLEAEKAVFRDQSKLASALNSLKRFEKSSGALAKAGAVALDTIQPFTKTPINIMRRGADFSPLGIVKGLTKLGKDAPAAIDDIAKGLTGTGVMALGFALASGGILTGKADADKDMRAYDLATGNSAFSVLGQYTYDWAQPFAIPLSVGVAIYEAFEKDPRVWARYQKALESGDTETANKLAGDFGMSLLDAFSASGDTVIDMSVMQGIKSLLGDPQGFTAGLSKLPSNYAKQFIPTVAGQLAGTIDPTARQTNYGSTNPFTGDFWKTQGATVAAKIPGVSTMLQPQITPFGKEKKGEENPILRTLQNFISPGRLTTPQEIDPQVDREVRRLFSEGQAQQFPITVARSFKFMDKTVSLSDAEYTAYQRTTGTETINAFKDILNSAEYRKIPAKELATKYKALAAKRGVTVETLKKDPAILARLTEEYKAAMLADGIVYARSLAQLEILKKRGLIGKLTTKQLADRMGVSQEIAGKLK